MRILAGLILMLVLALPGVAAAQTVTYNVSGSFQAPGTGTFTGSFVYDPGISKVTSANISVSAGLTNTGAGRAAQTYTAVSYSDPGVLFVSNTPFGSGNPGFGLSFSPNLNAGTPDVSSGSDNTCASASCDSMIARTSVNAASVVLSSAPPAPVPTLSEWAMILLALSLAGGAALVLQRRAVPA